MSSTDRTEQEFQLSVVILLTLHHPKEKEKTKQNKEVSKLERACCYFWLAWFGVWGSSEDTVLYFGFWDRISPRSSVWLITLRGSSSWGEERQSSCLQLMIPHTEIPEWTLWLSWDFHNAAFALHCISRAWSYYSPKKAQNSYKKNTLQQDSHILNIPPFLLQWLKIKRNLRF